MELLLSSRSSRTALRPRASSSFPSRPLFLSVGGSCNRSSRSTLRLQKSQSSLIVRRLPTGAPRSPAEHAILRSAGAPRPKPMSRPRRPASRPRAQSPSSNVTGTAVTTVRTFCTPPCLPPFITYCREQPQEQLAVSRRLGPPRPPPLLLRGAWVRTATLCAQARSCPPPPVLPHGQGLPPAQGLGCSRPGESLDAPRALFSSRLPSS